MFITTTPHLLIRRPSPTAASFTVTTLPHPTLALRLSLHAIYLLHIALSSTIVLFLYTLWAVSPYYKSTLLPPQYILSSPLPALAARITEIIRPAFAIPACVVALYALTRRLHVEESLLVLRGLGIQTSSSKDSFLFGKNTTRFIPTEKILDVVINEAFRGFEVRYYLVVLVEGERDVVVVFPRLLPRAEVVEKVWRGVRECLYERKVTAGGAGAHRYGHGDGDGNGDGKC
ncbi:GPI-GlcNAc transferase complex, PIG-H component-domain-containing protein [Astrocystis sublimbata]|nr:GPI-GlcNAc transferase complex, PIG-H component-domain-containing protein [Astrocystis sublimbata]